MRTGREERILPYLLESHRSNPMYGYTYNLFLNTFRTAGGITFGVAFFILSKTILHAQLNKSIITIGAGLVLLCLEQMLHH